jgi:hypothetical protein
MGRKVPEGREEENWRKEDVKRKKGGRVRSKERREEGKSGDGGGEWEKGRSKREYRRKG